MADRRRGAGQCDGGLLNYCAGRYVSGLSGRSWFPATEAQLAYVGSTFNRYGASVLLLAWLPVIGDLIAVMAGFLRTEIRLFVVLTAVGKFGRYAAIAAGMAWMQS
jgi:membrane protein YqaA with SNARE-associated domain